MASSSESEEIAIVVMQDNDNSSKMLVAVCSILVVFCGLITMFLAYISYTESKHHNMYKLKHHVPDEENDDDEDEEDVQQDGETIFTIPGRRVSHRHLLTSSGGYTFSHFALSTDDHHDVEVDVAPPAATDHDGGSNSFPSISACTSMLHSNDSSGSPTIRCSDGHEVVADEEDEQAIEDELNATLSDSSSHGMYRVHADEVNVTKQSSLATKCRWKGKPISTEYNALGMVAGNEMDSPSGVDYGILPIRRATSTTNTSSNVYGPGHARDVSLPLSTASTVNVNVNVHLPHNINHPGVIYEDGVNAVGMVDALKHSVIDEDEEGDELLPSIPRSNENYGRIEFNADEQQLSFKHYKYIITHYDDEDDDEDEFDINYDGSPETNRDVQASDGELSPHAQIEIVYKDEAKLDGERGEHDDAMGHVQVVQAKKYRLAVGDMHADLEMEEEKSVSSSTEHEDFNDNGGISRSRSRMTSIYENMISYLHQDGMRKFTKSMTDIGSVCED